jgi:hypothetical protein
MVDCPLVPADDDRNACVAMTNPYESPSADEESLATHSAEPIDGVRQNHLSAMLLFASFLAIACIGGLFALRIRGEHGSTSAEIPNEAMFWIWVTVGFSLYAMLAAALTILTSVRWFRSRLMQATGYAIGLCLFFAAAQVIEPIEPFNEPHTRWTIGVTSLSLAIWFAITCRIQIVESKSRT